MKKPKKVFAVRLPENLITKVRVAAAKTGVTIETLVAEAITAHLKAAK